MTIDREAAAQGTATTAAPEPAASVPSDPALAEAVKVLGDVTKNEETRFSNLNTRGVAVVSATSLITALAGVFSKDLFATTTKLDGWGLSVGRAGLLLTLIGLIVTTVQVVVRVLLPKGRLVFGDNALTLTPSKLKKPEDVDRVAFTEYRQIYPTLVTRNNDKAKALNQGYQWFLLTVAVMAATVALVVVSTI